MSQFSFYKKDLCFDRNLLCFVSLYLPRSCLALAAYNKTNITSFFCLISNLFTLGNIIFNSGSSRWITKGYGIFAYCCSFWIKSELFFESVIVGSSVTVVLYIVIRTCLRSLLKKRGRLNGELRWVESYGLWRRIWRVKVSW